MLHGKCFNLLVEDLFLFSEISEFESVGSDSIDFITLKEVCYD